MKEVLSDYNLLLLFIAFILNLPQVLFKSIRWKYLLSLQGFDISVKNTFNYYLSSLFLGVITPGRLGDFAKVLYLKQEDGCPNDLGTGFSSVLVDRLCDLYILFFISMIGLVTLSSLSQVSAFGWIGLWFSIALLFLTLNLKELPSFLLKIYEKYIDPKIPSGFRTKAKEFGKGILDLRKGLFLALAITVMSYALFFFQCFLIAKSLYLPLSYWAIVPLMAIINLLSFIPISVSGIGIRDAAMILIFGQHGLPLESSLAFSMGILLIFYIGGGMLGFFAWYLNPLELKKNLRASRTEK